MCKSCDLRHSRVRSPRRLGFWSADALVVGMARGLYGLPGRDRPRSWPQGQEPEAAPIIDRLLDLAAWVASGGAWRVCGAIAARCRGSR